MADGPFPLVLFSHGFASYPEYSAGHLAHLASWGIFTAAPDHVSRNLTGRLRPQVAQGDADVDDLRATLAARAHRVRGRRDLRRVIDFDQIAAEGHSAGGGAPAELLNDPEITTFIGLAPASPLDISSSGGIDDAALAQAYADATPPQKPSMIIAGERDGIIPLASISAPNSTGWRPRSASPCWPTPATTPSRPLRADPGPGRSQPAHRRLPVRGPSSGSARTAAPTASPTRRPPTS